MEIQKIRNTRVGEQWLIKSFKNKNTAVTGKGVWGKEMHSRYLHQLLIVNLDAFKKRFVEDKAINSHQFISYDISRISMPQLLVFGPERLHLNLFEGFL